MFFSGCCVYIKAAEYPGLCIINPQACTLKDLIAGHVLIFPFLFKCIEFGIVCILFEVVIVLSTFRPVLPRLWPSNSFSLIWIRKCAIGKRRKCSERLRKAILCLGVRHNDLAASFFCLSHALHHRSVVVKEEASSRGKSPRVPLRQIFASKHVRVECKNKADPIALDDGYGTCVTTLFIRDVVRGRRIAIRVVGSPNGIQLHSVVHSISASFISGVQDIIVIMPILYVSSIG